MKNTRTNIMAATKKLIVEKGYSGMTTKDIAIEAQVNEATLFRQFGSKKELLLATLREADWIPSVNEGIFERFQWELAKYLRLVMEEYLEQVTPEIVRFSLGLRAQEIYQETMPYVQKIPTAFIKVLEDYFLVMEEKAQIAVRDPKATAEVIFSSMIGFAFLHAYSSKDQYEVEVAAFISSATDRFINGLIQ
ncbi:TetR/AcrR family transcriptional regulator [Enterococcus raffinosus]|uniref:TetR/AcrR family transcriptional regulator n=1 Tax=Enterococcus raffinosus TaxID=71452 RepID=A0AAW8TGS1_9ENTE|nr:TetR/AcrR family transcriptional regulator [Enterococcus raffinosus]MDT2545940.1 TetR/AcrR family transcriptional regulator [Enterococcus raffinosus]